MAGRLLGIPGGVARHHEEQIGESVEVADDGVAHRMTALTERDRSALGPAHGRTRHVQRSRAEVDPGDHEQRLQQPLGNTSVDHGLQASDHLRDHQRAPRF